MAEAGKPIMTMMKIVLGIILFIVVIYAFYIMSEGIEAKGRGKLCQERARLKMEALHKLEEAGFPGAKELKDIDKAFDGPGGLTGWIANGISGVTCFFGGACKPKFDKEAAMNAFATIREAVVGVVEEVFYLGPECGSIIFMGANNDTALVRIAEEINACYEFGNVVRTQDVTCTYTFALNLTEGDISDCDVARAMYYTFPLTWGDWHKAPNFYSDSACPTEDYYVNGDRIFLNDGLAAAGGYWKYPDRLKEGEIHYFTIYYNSIDYMTNGPVLVHESFR